MTSGEGKQQVWQLCNLVAEQEPVHTCGVLITFKQTKITTVSVVDYARLSHKQKTWSQESSRWISYLKIEPSPAP